jgi:hypothetical protein
MSARGVSSSAILLQSPTSPPHERAFECFVHQRTSDPVSLSNRFTTSWNVSSSSLSSSKAAMVSVSIVSFSCFSLLMSDVVLYSLAECLGVGPADEVNPPHSHGARVRVPSRISISRDRGSSSRGRRGSGRDRDSPRRGPDRLWRVGRGLPREWFWTQIPIETVAPRNSIVTGRLLLRDGRRSRVGSGRGARGESGEEYPLRRLYPDGIICRCPFRGPPPVHRVV